jgi:PTH1 family peptidyl-tRNA hydrolase
MDTPLLIAGLGNPGSQYARNRHNAGFIVADELHAHYKFGPWKAKFDGLLSEGVLAGRKTYLLKPQTYMNLSGGSVAPALKFYKIPLEALVVIHDEIDLAAGKLKVKTGGGDAGQNGLRSITSALGPDYRRVRLGIGHPGDKSMVHSYVLNDFARSEQAWVSALCDGIARNCAMLTKRDDAGFQNKLHLFMEAAGFGDVKTIGDERKA